MDIVDMAITLTITAWVLSRRPVRRVLGTD